MPTQSFGKYVVTGTLGKGGMAEVYQGTHPELKRRVAIKVIHPHLSDEETLGERFRREANLIASLRHPHIIQLYDFEVVGHQFYMVMEYLEGGTLKDRLKQLRARREVMSLEEAVRLLDPLAMALDYAHARGAIHRDIKPANILFTHEGEPVLSDFGIAKFMGEGTQLSLTGGLVGTPNYMSPEQAATEGVSRASDIYSLAVVFYEMVTGRVPFQGDSITAVLLKQINEPPPPPRTINPNIPPAVEAAILKSLTKEPGGRHNTAGDLARAVRAGLQGRPAPADAPPPVSRHDEATLMTHAGVTGQPGTKGAPSQDRSQSGAATGAATARDDETQAGRTVQPTAAGRTQLDQTLATAVRTGAPPALAGLLLLPALILVALQLAGLAGRQPPGAQPFLAPVIVLSFIAAAVAGLVGIIRQGSWRQRLPSAATVIAVALLALGWGAWQLARQPEPTIPVTTGDFVIAVADFDGTAATRRVDFGRRIFEQLQAELDSGDGVVAIVRLDQTYPDAQTARAQAAAAGATLVIWGWYDDIGVSPHVELLELPALTQEVTAVTLELPGAVGLVPAAPSGPTLQDFTRFTRIPLTVPTFDLFIQDGSRQLVYIATSILGLTYFAGGDYDQALALFDRALANAPADASAGREILLFHRATVLYEQGRAAEAIADLEQALALQPDLLEARHNLALALSQGCGAAGQIQQAIDAAAAAVQLAPESAVARALLGDLYRQAGRYEEAVPALERAVELDPTDSDAAASLAAAYDENGLSDAAAETWLRVIALRQAELAAAGEEQERVEAHLRLGDALLGAGNYGGARQEYEAARALDADEPRVFRGLGNAYFWQGRHEDAENAYRHWLELSPGNSSAHMLFGFLLLEQARNQEAIAQLEEAATLAGCDPTPQLLLGGLYWQQGDYPQAVTAYEAAVGLDAANADAHYLLGVTRYFAAVGQDQAVARPLLLQAAQALQRATELQPAAVDSYFALGQVYMDLEEYPAAAVAWGRVVELQPEVAANYRSLAWAFEKLGLWEQAAAAYEVALSLEEDATTHSYLAIAYHQLGRLDEAIAHYEQAIELAPDDALAFAGLGELYWQQGRLDEAAEATRRALDLEPSAPLHYQLGLIYERQGQAGPAMAEYEAAVALNPDDWPGFLRLGHLQAQAQALDAAEAAYAAALAINPDSAEAHFGLGSTAYKQCNLTIMEQALDTAARLAPDLSLYQAALAGAHQAQGRDTETAQIFARLQSAGAGDPIAHLLAADYLYRAGQLSEAQRELQMVLAADLTPIFASLAHTGLGQIYYDQASFGPAHGEYEVALELLPGNADAMTRLGDIPLRSADPGLALGTYDAAVLLLPDYARQVSADAALTLPIYLQVRRAIALRQLGLDEEAADALVTAVALGQELIGRLPGWPHAHLALAFAYQANGDEDRVQLELAAAVACDRSLATVWEQLAANLALLQGQ